MLSKQAIEEFRNIYFKEYGETLSFDEASQTACDFLHLYRAVFCPSSETETNKSNDKKV